MQGGWGHKGLLRGGKLGGHDKDRQVGAYIVCTNSSTAQKQASTYSSMVTSKSAHNTGTNKSAERIATSSCTISGTNRSQTALVQAGV